MKRARARFLPIFFASLAVVWVILVAIRIRSYRDPARRALPVSEPRVTTQSTEVPASAVAQPAPLQPDQAREEEKSESATAPEEVRSPLEVQSPLEAVWFDPKSVRTGRAEALRVRTHRGAAVTGMRGSLRHVSANARLSFECAAAADREWTCAFDVPSCVACGRWRIEKLNVTSGANTTEVESAATISLSGERCDLSPPTVHAMSVAPAGDDTDDFLIVFTAADLQCGIARLEATLTAADGQTARVTAEPAGDEGSWAGRFQVSRSTARGDWRLTSVEATDEAGNTATYSAQSALLADASFRVR